MQETWLNGDFSRKMNGFHILHHGLKNKSCRRGERFVAIILSSTGFEAYKSAGELPPITSSTNGHASSGRHMSINLRMKVHFKCIKGAFRNNRLKHINLEVIIVSMYFPIDCLEHDEMLEFVDSKMSERPMSNRLVIGQYRNAKVGVSDNHDIVDVRETTLGKLSDPSRNAKGENLLVFARAANLLIANTWFEHNSHTT